MLTTLLGSTRNRVIALALVALVLGGVTVAVVTSGDDPPPPTTTTTSSTTTTTAPTTTVPEPVAPLTGLPGDFEGRTDRPALVVKIDNVEPKSRPQAGLNQADVVYEERVEGSVTRLLAIFHSIDAAPVGPVRSGRTTDILVYSPLNRPYFAWSGANADFTAQILASNMFDVSHNAQSGHYYRAGDRPGSHDLMLRGTPEVLAIPSEGSGPPPPLFTYRAPADVPANLQPVEGVRVTYGTSAGSAPVEYRWNGEGWARSQAGTPHVDATGAQVAPANVIVQFTPYVSSGVNDQFGEPIPVADMVGEGDAWVLTDGGMIAGRWQKTAVDAVTTYTDVDGNPIGLTPGRTWVALVQPGGGEQL